MTKTLEPKSTPVRCEKCRGRGWRIEEDGGAGCAIKCECRDPAANPQLLRRRMVEAGMEIDEIESAFTDWDETVQPRPVWSRQWLDWVLTGTKEGYPKPLAEHGPLPRNPWVLTLLGGPGRGKTKTAAVLMRRYISGGGSSGLWIRGPEAFDRVQAERSEVGDSAYELRLSSASLLVLDELGLHHRAQAEVMAATTAEWLCRRQRRRLPTVITTNAESLSDLGDSRLESRLAEGFYRLMAGPDYRDIRGRPK